MGNDNSTPNPPNEVFLARTCRWQHFRHLSNLAIVREISAKMPSEAGHRLYVKGRHISYQRGKRNTTPGTSLIQIEGVSDTKGANFYLGQNHVVPIFDIRGLVWSWTHGKLIDELRHSVTGLGRDALDTQAIVGNWDKAMGNAPH